ncbi:DUF5615 family PIN-like protein [Spirulina sp. CS-785/01]|uniref:DUF5615 family PIN-like protein n=1 Tax=Spirulina sp. CS-785/01 TaxID=3021716 RepID=UPI00233033AF|nr:DUF5615 family PIN-like protein [Spirulina sp. CS-785/01]MDB9314108.1 DUF5615 family PIN-like protein [Spirulina sp. CS-785/01]
MKFLIDVNASRTLGLWLVNAGYDVAYVSDINPEMTDEAILVWAVIEKRIILTTDNDFEQMIWQNNQKHYGVIRLENLPRQERQELLAEVLANYSQDLQNGAIIIALTNKIRIRRFP